MPQIVFFNTIFSKESMKLNTEKMQGITEMPPSDVQLQIFLGMLNFMQAYVSHLLLSAVLLSELLKKNKYFTGMITQIHHSGS